MEHIRAWLKEQWGIKRFRILLFVMLLFTIILAAEFCLFQYGGFKIVRYFILFWSLTVIAWTDCRSRRIPNAMVLFLLTARTVLLVMECLAYREYWKSVLLSSAGGLFLGGGMFLVCYLLARGGIGAGDVKLSAMLGYYLGSGAVFTAIFLTVLTAALFSIAVLLLKKANLKQEIPFAPFILTGTLITMMLGV